MLRAAYNRKWMNADYLFHVKTPGSLKLFSEFSIHSVMSDTMDP